MGELIDLPYRRFPRHVIDKLVRVGYLQSSERHKVEEVTLAWDRFRQRINMLVADRHRPRD
jgi:hypothetical protein